MWSWFSSFIANLQASLETPELDEVPREPESTPEVEETDEVLVPAVGAWCGQSSLRNPERDVQLARSVGLRRLDVIVNDHSAARNPRRFDIYDRERIVRLCRIAKDADLDVHLMSWIMPHAAYLREAARVLLPLAEDTGASSIQWDAEEPWTRARKGMEYEAAGALVGELFAGVKMGVNGIGYVSAAKMGPLAAVCDYLVPQCYATANNTLRPETAVPKLVRRWRKHFGEKPFVPGLAAYRQSGIPGHTVSSAMRSAFAGAEATGAQGVIYWHLSNIRRERKVAKAVREITGVGAVA